MKYNTMNNNEIILSLCARIKETRISLSLTQQQLADRALVGIATVNYPAGQPDCNGHSTAFDGIAYKPDEPGSRDTLLIEAGEREGIYLADFPLDDIREYRKSEVHGNAYRHPQKYHLLVDEKIEEPFLREDYRK